MSTAVKSPVRVRHAAELAISAPADTVFPLLCPVREIDWVDGWQPDWVISASGVAEDGCLFQTPDEGHGPATWVITDHDPDGRRIAMVKLVPGHLATRLVARVEPVDANRCQLTISYEHTALGAKGEPFVIAFDQAHWRAFIEPWGPMIEAYLAGDSD